jgi:phage recombination protein Bet
MSQQTLAPIEKPGRTSALAVMASRFSVEPTKLLETLKVTVFKGATDAELMALCIVANEYGLNPLTKEIYAFPAKGGGIVPVVSVDGWIRIINDHPQMDGLEFEWDNDKDGSPVSCTAIIYRKDRTRAIKVTEYLSECARNTEPWKMKHRMLRHKALIQCGRVAFGFGGIYDDDDANDIRPANAVEIKAPVFAPATVEAAQELPLGDPAGAAALPEQTAEQPKANTLKVVKATPREALTNLMRASHVEEPSVLTFLASQGEEIASLADADEQVIVTLVKGWSGFVEKIRGGGAQ